MKFFILTANGISPPFGEPSLVSLPTHSCAALRLAVGFA